ncbi:MAG TPA: 3-dehydroquinate synthase [bacterium]|nr:3-dehydroquinate synthase [bacterium]
MKTIIVRLKEKTYRVFAGAGLLSRAGSMLKKALKGRRVLVVTNRDIYRLHGRKLIKSLSAHFTVFVHFMPDGEEHKNLRAVEGIYRAALKAGIDRSSAIIAFGGGVVGDTAGFAAATYMRGIALVQIPTTLLAQVDSSIGGKTGVDLKEGKNLAGAFYHPEAVIADSLVLETLSEREFKNGLVEAVKYGFIMDRPFFDFIRKNRKKILSRNPGVISKIVAASAADKAAIVEKDEKEKSGVRAILNYGHTIGHALEAESGYRGLKHGEAVALGMAAAAVIAYNTGYCGKRVLIDQINMLNALNLLKPLKKPGISNIIKRLYSDKKTLNGKIRFVLTKRIGCANLVKSVNKNGIKRALEVLSRFRGRKEEVLYGGRYTGRNRGAEEKAFTKP